VNGVRHTYTLAGSDIVCESWGSHVLIPMYDAGGSVYGILYDKEAYYFVRNLQGDVVEILDKSGTPMAEYAYDAWGKCTLVREMSGSGIGRINPFRYRGYYYDAETGLYYLKARYYDPEVGRFISPDDTSYLEPEVLNSLSLYAYCGSDPVMFVDPTGYAPEWLRWLGIGLAIVGTALVIGAVTVLTCGVGTALAGTMAGAIIYGAAQGIVIGATVGVVAGGVIGGALSDWSAEGILIGMGIGLGGGAIIGGVIGGFAGASSFTANNAYITQYGGNVKEVLSAFKGNPKLKNIFSGTKVNRYWGGTAEKIGRWVSPNMYSNPVKSLALNPVWGNTASNVSTLIFNQNATVLVGIVATQGGLSGGGIQYFVGNTAWLTLL